MSRKKVNLIVISITALLLFGIYKIVSSDTGQVPYKIIEQHNYDEPLKSQYDVKVTARSGLSKDSLTLLCNHLFSEAMKRSYKFYTPPSHIFIYVYDDTATHYELNWSAMISRIMNVNKGIEFGDPILKKLP